MNKANINTFFLILFLWSGLTFGQQRTPLSVVITQIETQFGYQFNYAEETIADIQLTPPSETLSMSQTLDYLRKETGLTFDVLENKIISIQGNRQGKICGYLKDKETQTELTSASIQSSSGSAITDANGYFELDVNSPNELLVIRYLGYRSIYREAGFFSKDCAPVYMIAEPETLSAVVLSNYLVEGISQLNSGAYAIDLDRFDILPGLIEADVLQSVQALPGIQSINETVSNLNIRGGSHDQNLILWDGIKMYQSGHFFGLISAFNPHITQRVTLQKNGSNARYSDGVSGTIHMESNPGITTETQGKIGLNLLSADGFIDLPVGPNSSLQIAARKSLSDFWKTPTYSQYFERISQDTEVEANEAAIENTDRSFDFYDASLRWNYQITEQDRLRVNFMVVGNQLQFDENTQIDGEARSRQSVLDQNSLVAGLQYHRNWSDEIGTSFEIYNTEYKLEATNANLLLSQRFLQENSVSETGVRASGRYKWSKRFFAEAGYQFVESEVTNLDDVDVPIFRSLITEVIRTHSPYVNLEWQSADSNTFINLGARHNYLDKLKVHRLEPRLSVNHKFTDELSADVQVEFKHQITSQIINFQNDFLGIEKRRWQLSNGEDVPIITSMQAGGGLNYSDRQWLVSAHAYYKKVEGITAQSQGFLNQFEFVKSTGNYTAVGVDFIIRKRFNKANIWASYSWIHSQYTFESLLEDPFPSNFDITHAATLGITYEVEKLQLAAGVNYHSGIPTTLLQAGNEVTGQNLNFQQPNSSRLDPYLRVDVSATYEFELGKSQGEIGVSVWNVLNRENEIGSYYRLDGEGNPQEFVQNALELTPNAVVRMYF